MVLFARVRLEPAAQVRTPRLTKMERLLGDPGQRMTEILSQHGYEFHNITDSGPEWRPEIVPVEAYKNWLCSPSPRTPSYH